MWPFSKKPDSDSYDPVEQREKEVIAHWVEILKWNNHLISACKYAKSAADAYREAEFFLGADYCGTEICPIDFAKHKKNSLLERVAIIAAGEIFLNLQSVKEKAAVPV
jgi:hypothetical protein